MKKLKKAADLTAYIQRVSKELESDVNQFATDVAEEVATNVYNESQDLVPVDEGDLRASGKTESRGVGRAAVVYDDWKAAMLNYNIPTWQPAGAPNGTVTDSRVQGNQKNYTKPGTGYLYIERSVDAYGTDQEIEKVAERHIKKLEK